MSEFPHREPPRTLISETSDEYLKRREAMQSRVAAVRVFGRAELQKMAALNDENNLVQKVLEDPSNKEESIQTTLTGLRERLSKMYQSPAKKALVDDLFYATINSPAVQRVIGREESAEIGGWDREPSDLFDSDKISTEAFTAIVEEHNRQFGQKAAEYQLGLPERLAKIRSSIIDWAQEKNVPISQELIEERFAATQFQLVDGLVYDTSDVGGKWNSESETIEIGAHLPQEAQPFVEVHEIFHMLSGRTQTAKDNPFAFLGSTFAAMGVEDVRSGFATLDSQHIQRTFYWLNEAMTEFMTDNLMDRLGTPNEKYKTYPLERALVQIMLEDGKEDPQEGTEGHPPLIRRLRDAYFENYDPTNKENPQPLRRQVVKAIDEAYQPGFLRTLDQFVTKYKIPTAVRTMSEDWTRIVRDEPLRVNLKIVDTE